MSFFSLCIFVLKKYCHFFNTVIDFVGLFPSQSLVLKVTWVNHELTICYAGPEELLRNPDAFNDDVPANNTVPANDDVPVADVVSASYDDVPANGNVPVADDAPASGLQPPLLLPACLVKFSLFVLSLCIYVYLTLLMPQLVIVLF